MEDYKNRVEAILFTTGRFMDVDEIARLCGIGSVGVISEILDGLRKDYDGRSTALSLLLEDNKFKMGIKKEYNYLTSSLMGEAELDGPATKTLALIAYKQPVIQSEIIDMRGNTAYDHVKLLKEQGFIISEKKGRTRMLKLASKFFDYFDVIENELKAKIVSGEAEKLEQETKIMENNLNNMEETKSCDNSSNSQDEKEAEHGNNKDT